MKTVESLRASGEIPGVTIALKRAEEQTETSENLISGHF